MRNRLLASAAILAVGVAMASAQHAPGGAGQGHPQANGKAHHSQGAAAGKSAQAQRTQGAGRRQDKGSGPDIARKPRHAMAKQRDAQGAATTVRPNDAAPPRGMRDHGGRNGMASDKSILDRAMAQGLLQSEARHGQGNRRHGRPSSAAPAGRDTKDLGVRDHARSQTAHRRPEQAMGRASGQGLKAQSGKTQPTKTQPSKARTAGAVQSTSHGDSASHAGQTDIRNVQTALNQQGFNVGDPDGKLGKRTKKALIAFQKQHGVQATGKVDHATLQALGAGGRAPDTSKDSSNKAGDSKDGGSQTPQAPTPAAATPQNGPAAPTTTGQENVSPAANPPQPVEAETPPAPQDNNPQLPDAGSRVPAGAPQEDYKDDMLPSDNDQR